MGGNDTFYVQRMGSEDGPHSVLDLQMMVRNGSLKSNSLLRKESGGQWFQACDVPGLFSDKDWLTALLLSLLLGYLGIGLRPSTDPTAFFITSWGVLMLDGQSAINSQPFLLLSPAICVALIVLAFTFLGDGLRDALDPRLARQL